MGREGVKGLDRRAASGTLLTLLLVGLLAVTINVSVVEASGTVYIRADGSVDPSSAPISTVDNVTYTLTDNVNDSIVVERDNIVLDGAGYTVQGTGNGTGIDLSGRSNVTVKNITVTRFYYGIYLSRSGNNTVSDNNANNNGYGIYLAYSNGNTVSDNTANNNDWGGIRLHYSGNNTVSGNNAANNIYDGIFLYSSSNNTVSANNATHNQRDGIYLAYSNGNTVLDNTAKNNWGCGISSSGSSNTVSGNNANNNGYYGILLSSSNNNTISGNNANNNAQDGIHLDYSSNNIISGNNIRANNRYGILLYEASNNKFYHNNFIDNTRQVAISVYCYANLWDVGYPSGGNCWSDYTGVDVKSGPDQDQPGSDEIGDTPYVIDANNRDNYPLMYPYGLIYNLDTNLTYLTIQSAINANETMNGHTIFVRSGTYYEHVVVNKSVSLVGEDRSTTIIDGNRTGIVMKITANNVNISGFTIQNSGTISLYKGVYVDHSSGNNISHNIITTNFYGLYLEYSNNNTVSDNIVNSNGGGIYLYYSDDNTVSDNNANNEVFGIDLHESSDNTVSGNTANNNDFGIYLDLSGNNTISDNNVNNNAYCGIGFFDSSNNYICHNNFIDNIDVWGTMRQVWLYNSLNTWDDGYPSGGNYWSDYTGVDNCSGPYQNWMGSDGIGDTPYVIDANNRDNYPLMAPWPPNGTWTAPHNARAVYPGLGWHINITVFLQNQGNETETFNVTAYYDSQTIGNQTVEVVPGVWRTLTFTWDTTGIAPCEYNYTSDQYIPYTINVNVSTPTLGETTWYHGTVTVRRFGDANGDGHCDGFDFTMLNLCWLTVYPDERYNPNADFNGDDSIDGFDYTHINLKWLTY